jgi:hypothetical protein
LAGSDTHGDDAQYLDLAREIQREVTRVAADESSDPEALDAVFEGITRRERLRVLRETFDRLPATEQWAVLERTFADDELAEALAGARAARLAAAQRRERAAMVTTGERLDTLAVPADELIVLGLFLEPDVRGGIARGPGSTNCVRRLVLKATAVADAGAFQVIEDVFNPRGGYFVTPRYDEAFWRSHDRLAAHALVRLGSIVPSADGPGLDPVLHLGGRVDVETQGELREGHLHLGFALLDDVDVFAASREE